MAEFTPESDDPRAAPENREIEEPAANDGSVDRGGVAAIVGLVFLLALAALVRWRRSVD
jgi:hypothetical protein